MEHIDRTAVAAVSMLNSLHLWTHEVWVDGCFLDKMICVASNQC